ncbi:MAG: aldehyde ferredoxin oxidoreductase C-terminal domain-containing protein [Desulfobacterales bacterium]
MNSILRVNVSDGSIRKEPVPKDYGTLGGRALTARILLDEVKPTCEPLGPHNKLIFACGLLSGTSVSSCGRLSIGAKSPLTGGIKESNAGGITAMRMARIGIRAIIVEGLPKDDSAKILLVEPEKASLLPADEHAGLGVYETAKNLLENYSQSAVTCIGPAGELQLASAGIATIDSDGVPSRFSGRGGLGAVMGCKGLKAVVVKGRGKIIPARKDEFIKISRELNNAIISAPLTAAYRDYGTAAMVEYINELNGLPICNFSRGKDDKAKNIGGDAMREMIVERGGEGRTDHACMPGCLVRCSNVFVDKNGYTLVSPLEYETIGLLGCNLDIWKLDDIAKLNYHCNNIGVDTIEIGAAIGVMMEANLMRFGDFEGVMKVLDEVRRGTIVGRLLGSGAMITGKVLGVKNIPVVKGQAMAAYDPRAIKGMGVTYATSAMGADHTAGPAARAPVDHSKAEGKAQLSRKLQKLLGVFDATGLCLFTIGGVAANKRMVLDALNALYGWDHNMEWLDGMCIQMLNDEIRFNELAGITAAHHRLSEAFTEREMPGICSVFDVTDQDIESVFDYDQQD